MKTLITSINNRCLVFFCGAGLSMDPPSSLPSAYALVQKLEEKYQRLHGESLVGTVGNKIEEIAKWALDNAPEFQNFFLPTINSEDFFKASNPGHETVADFLIARIAEAALSTNVDYLVEHAAKKLGKGRFRGVVRRSHFNRNPDHSPLLKVHGCFDHEEQHTVWCEQQLNEAPIRGRVERFQTWMQEHLPGKDLLVIGYWTDWPHLNETLNRSIQDHYPRSVTLVDPSSPEELKEKAEGLWEWVDQSNDVNFQHVRACGNEFMERLRQEFSAWFFRELLHEVRDEGRVLEYYGVASTEQVKLPPLDHMAMKDIYDLRRDFQGVPTGKPVTDRDPTGAAYERVGALHQLLMEGAATMEGRLYKLGGAALRLVNSQGREVERVKDEFARAGDTPRGVTAHVCVGSRGSLPGRQNLVREPTDDDVVRTGQAQVWWTDDDLVRYLQNETDLLNTTEDE
ncbi:MAG: SIR2 family protein [Rhodothermales bacterium]